MGGWQIWGMPYCLFHGYCKSFSKDFGRAVPYQTSNHDFAPTEVTIASMLYSSFPNLPQTPMYCSCPQTSGTQVTLWVATSNPLSKDEGLERIAFPTSHYSFLWEKDCDSEGNPIQRNPPRQFSPNSNPDMLYFRCAGGTGELSKVSCTLALKILHCGSAT